MLKNFPKSIERASTLTWCCEYISPQCIVSSRLALLLHSYCGLDEARKQDIILQYTSCVGSDYTPTFTVIGSSWSLTDQAAGICAKDTSEKAFE